MVSIVLGKWTWKGINDGTYFFSVICPLLLVCSPAVLTGFSCLVTVDLDGLSPCLLPAYCIVK